MCDCPEAQKWRAYWTREAIAERLAAEVALYREVVATALFWGVTTFGPTRPPRLPSSMSNVELPDSHAAKERLRNTPGQWPPRRRGV